MSARIALLTLAVVAISLMFACGHPTDQELIDRFVAHRQDFETLLRMAQEDAEVRRIAPDFTSPADSLPPERWDEYRRLFDEVGLDDGVTNWQPSGPIEFTASSRGLATGGDSKGYAYSERALRPLHESLNTRPRGSESNVPVYRPIEEGWYLYYSWDD